MTRGSAVVEVDRDGTYRLLLQTLTTALYSRGDLGSASTTNKFVSVLIPARDRPSIPTAHCALSDQH